MKGARSFRINFKIEEKDVAVIISFKPPLMFFDEIKYDWEVTVIDEEYDNIKLIDILDDSIEKAE